MFGLSLQARFLLAFVAVVLIQAVVTAGVTLNSIQAMLERRIGDQALQLSKVVSSLPQIKQGLRERDVELVQPLAETLRAQTDARFIVVGDREGIRFSHPIPERIGKQRVGGDNQRALDGESYVSRAIGSLGPSIRGKSPVISEHGEVIGVTSVGYMLDTVEQTIRSYQFDVLGVLLLSLLASFVAAVLLARYFKRILFGLEPEEIARLYEERHTTLQTIREGILAVDNEGRITTINKKARELFRIGEKDVIGRSIRDVLPQSGLMNVVKTGEVELDREISRFQIPLIVNRLPIIVDNQIKGAVSSFRPKGEIEQLSRELSQVQQYAETLRAQSHDYVNKLHTIAGLIQIGADDQALELIGQESKGIQALVQLLTSAVEDPVVAGLILGKYNRANELGLTFKVDPEVHMASLPAHIPAEKLVSMLGNIVDNAFEATRSHNEQNPASANTVTLSISDYGHDFIFEVEDSGNGIAEPVKEQIFDKGISTKEDDGHGYGLYLVKSICDQLGGQIELAETENGGTRFIVYLPKSLATGPKH